MVSNRTTSCRAVKGFGGGVGIKLRRQGLRPLRCCFQPVAGGGKRAARAFFVAEDMLFQALHHFVAMDGRLNVLVMQQ